MKLCCNENLEDKRKLRYYKDFINPNLEDQNYLFILTNVKKKIHIAKIRTKVLMSCIVKQVVGPSLKLCGLKGFVIFVWL